MSLNVLRLKARMHQKGDQTKGCRSLGDEKKKGSVTSDYQLYYIMCDQYSILHSQGTSPCVESQLEILSLAQ